MSLTTVRRRLHRLDTERAALVAWLEAEEPYTVPWQQMDRTHAVKRVLRGAHPQALTRAEVTAQLARHGRNDTADEVSLTLSTALKRGGVIRVDVDGPDTTPGRPTVWKWTVPDEALPKPCP